MAYTSTLIKPGTPLAQLLQALRGAQLTPSEISERWISGSTNIKFLVSLGYAESRGTGSYYRITEAGREACPERRAA